MKFHLFILLSTTASVLFILLFKQIEADVCWDWSVSLSASGEDIVSRCCVHLCVKPNDWVRRCECWWQWWRAANMKYIIVQLTLSWMLLLGIGEASFIFPPLLQLSQFQSGIYIAKLRKKGGEWVQKRSSDYKTWEATELELPWQHLSYNGKLLMWRKQNCRKNHFWLDTEPRSYFEDSWVNFFFCPSTCVCRWYVVCAGDDICDATCTFTLGLREYC